MNSLLSTTTDSLARRINFRHVLGQVSHGFSTHRSLYAIALVTFALALAVAPVSGNWPDFDIVQEFGFYLAVAAGIGVLAGLTIKFAQLALFERPQSPSRALLLWLKDSVFRGDRVVNTIHSFIVLLIFVSGFSILKGAIGLLYPFDWDPFFRDMDIALSGGRMPHEWLAGLTSQPLAVWIINFNYNLWYFIVLGTYFSVGMAAHNSVDRMRFLTSFFLLWLIAGVFIAFAFSSAGPVYYERLGLGTDYVPLMTSLHAAAEHHQIWALSTQDTLWEGFIGARKGSAGISAFPSLHVASSVLVAIYATHVKSRLAVAAWIFAAGIFLGSVVLAWHYAVDGYAGALLALLIWKLSDFRIFKSAI
jgi:hypothetical protein